MYLYCNCAVILGTFCFSWQRRSEWRVGWCWAKFKEWSDS